MKKLSKVLAVAMAASMAAGMAILPASATILTDQTLTKISNPGSGPRDADGLVPEGDRETSYAWCIAARGDYVYIGTNKNIVGSVVESLTAALEAAGISEDQAWKLADVMMNGEIPRPTTTEGGQILRVNCLTNEIDVIYTADAGTSFRMAITHGDNVYFGSYTVGAGDSFTTDTEEGLSNDIFCIDAEDNVTKVFSSFNGTSMRAACEYEGSLFFGGVDAEEELPEDWAGAAKLAILQMDEDDNTKWTRVADYEDFGKRYAKDPAMTSAAASPVWDICAYNGDLYATLPSALGFVVFRGHPAKDGETANKYGWVWEEVVGLNNNYGNPIGLNPEASVQTAGAVSVVATPVVFNGELYLFDFDHTIGSVTQAVTGVLQSMLGQDVKASDYLRPMYNTLQHTQSLWKLNNETGQFEKVEAFSEMLENTCNEYVWRAEVYDGQLYITTMDSAVLYNGVTRLTNGSFVNMTAEEWKDQIVYLAEFAASLNPKTSAAMAEAKAKIEEVVAYLKEMYAQLATNEDVQAFAAAYAEAMQKVSEALAPVRAELAQSEFVQAVMAKLVSVKTMTMVKYAAVSAKVRQFILDYDLSALITGVPGGTLYDLSDEELDEYIAAFQAKVEECVESLKIRVPELKPIDVEALKAAVAEYAAQVIDQTIGYELYEAILNLKTAFKNRVQYQADILKDEIVAKVSAAYEKLPEEKRAQIEAYVQEAFTKIADEYNAQVAKIEALKEKAAKIKGMTYADYQALLEQAIDIGAAKTLEAFDALDAELQKVGLTFTDEVKAGAVALVDEKKAEAIQKLADLFSKLTPDTSLTPAQAAKYAALEKLQALEKKVNAVYYKAREAYDNIDWEGLKMYAYINDAVKHDTWGFDMLRTADGENFELVTEDGFDDKYNYGGRCMVATQYGLYVGTANPFYGAQLYRINDQLNAYPELSADTINLGEEVTVKFNAFGGTGEIRNTVLYRKTGSTKWTMVERNSTADSVSFAPKTAHAYEIRVLTKDADGTVIKTTMPLNVVKPLENDSTLSAETIKIGEKIKVRAIAKGGDGNYQYAVYYKKAASENWSLVHDYSEYYAFNLNPSKATDYKVLVKVKDSTGTEVEKELAFTVTAE